MVLTQGANQYIGPSYSVKACYVVAGDITTSVNKGRQAGWVNEQSTYLDVYAVTPEYNNAHLTTLLSRARFMISTKTSIPR